MQSLSLSPLILNFIPGRLDATSICRCFFDVKDVSRAPNAMDIQLPVFTSAFRPEQ
jgi:hypothetical protein